MAAGLGLLRLSPRDFWAMTPRELAAAMRALAPARAGRPRRGEMEALMRMFPDRRNG